MAPRRLSTAAEFRDGLSCRLVGCVAPTAVHIVTLSLDDPATRAARLAGTFDPPPVDDEPQDAPPSAAEERLASLF